MKEMFKDVAWRVSAFMLWYPLTPMFNADLVWWEEILIIFCFYICLDLIRWGLKKD